MFFNLEVSEQDEIEIKDLKFAKNNRLLIKFGKNCEILIREEDIEDLYKKIEQALWDEKCHRDYLQELSDDLEVKVDTLEEELEEANQLLEQYRLEARGF